MKFGKLEFLPLPEFGDRYCVEDKWLIRDWLPDSQMIFVVGPPKKKKSWTTIDMAVAVATGSKFMGVTPNRTGPVLFLQLEDPPNTTRSRFDLVGHSRWGGSARRPDNIFVLLRDGAFSLVDDACVAALKLAIEEIKPILIVIDSLYVAIRMDDYGVEGVGKLAVLKQWTEQYQCTMVIVHHSKKGAGVDAEGGHGTQFLNSVNDGSHQIRALTLPDKTEILTISRVFKSFESYGQMELGININSDMGTYDARVTPIIEESDEE